MTAEQNACWLLHSRTASFIKREFRARNIIQSALKRAKFAISWSGGKDSTAMTHLALSVDPELPVITQFDDCDWPEKAPYIEHMAARNFIPAFYPVAPGFSVWEKVLETEIGGDDICKLSHPITRDAFIQPLSDQQKRLGCDGVFLGLRDAESKARAMNRRTRGCLYRTAGGQWKCLPLAEWSAVDVFAYHVKHHLPINPLYFNNRIFEPENIRISWALPTRNGFSRGEMEHLKIYYPTQYNKLRKLCSGH